MQPSNSYEELIAMVDMHDDVLKRVETAYSNENYIECCWLCYACFESRVNRTMEKLCPSCTKPNRSDGRHIGISTKLACLNRLRRSGYELFDGANLAVVTNINAWCKERNKLIHELVSLGRYEQSNYEFKNLAKRGVSLVKRIYDSISLVRINYYNSNALPPFDESVVKTCKLKTKCIERGDL